MKYFGSKSLDAEIYIDFTSGEVRMDYSSNLLHSEYSSNTTARHDDSEWFNLHVIKRLAIQSAAFIFFTPLHTIVALAMPVSTFLTRHGLFPARFQYQYQKFLKTFYTESEGVYIEEFYGELSGTILQVLIDRNIWFSYELDGDYEKYIKNISFERRIRTYRNYNRWDLHVQDGWMLTFEFSQSPKDGTVVVKFV